MVRAGATSRKSLIGTCVGRKVRYIPVKKEHDFRGYPQWGTGSLRHAYRTVKTGPSKVPFEGLEGRI